MSGGGTPSGRGMRTSKRPAAVGVASSCAADLEGMATAVAALEAELASLRDGRRASEARLTAVRSQTDVVDVALFIEEYGRAVAPGVFYASLLAAQVAAAGGSSLSGSGTSDLPTLVFARNDSRSPTAESARPSRRSERPRP